ncbi:PmoA family protein [Chitinophaga sp. 22620]|uniref:DUF6807 domain-containing protein n=1 Tax=Chitinophaga sp. 22620 TaxID=3453952 RepID=UPI003F87614D
MKYPRYACLIILTFLSMTANAQLLARYTVKAGKYARHNTIISVPAEAQKGDVYQLYQVEGKTKTPVPLQAGNGRLVWSLGGDLQPGQRRVFELYKNGKDAVPVNPDDAVTVDNSAEGFTVKRGRRPVLFYQAAVKDVPPGVDTAFRRGGFIHPAYTPGGKVLTNIQPKDHYHHYGIWNPWTETEFEGQTVDFWNLKKLSGTVRVNFESNRNYSVSGPVWGGFLQVQDHVVLGKGGPDKTAINEDLEVSAYGGTEDVQIWDYKSTLSCGTASPIILKEYRYGGGFAIRAAEEWNNENSAVLTSEGKTRKDGDMTHARWFKVAGDLKGGKGGILVLSSPENFNAPQPLRIWPEKDQQGQVFAEFSPTKDKSWKLEPGKHYLQQYRVITFDGDLTAEQAEAYWNDYAHPPKVDVDVKK